MAFIWAEAPPFSASSVQLLRCDISVDEEKPPTFIIKLDEFFFVANLFDIIWKCLEWIYHKLMKSCRSLDERNKVSDTFR